MGAKSVLPVPWGKKSSGANYHVVKLSLKTLCVCEVHTGEAHLELEEQVLK